MNGSRRIGSYDKRFGVIAVEKAYITPEQLVEALRIQVTEEMTTGRHRLIGQILVAQNAMTAEQVEEIVSSVIGG